MLHPLKVGGTVSDGFLWWLFATVSTNQVLRRAAEYAPSLECAPQQNAGAEVGSGSGARSRRILRMSAFLPIASRKATAIFLR